MLTINKSFLPVLKISILVALKVSEIGELPFAQPGFFLNEKQELIFIGLKINACNIPV